MAGQLRISSSRVVLRCLRQSSSVCPARTFSQGAASRDRLPRRRPRRLRDRRASRSCACRTTCMRFSAPAATSRCRSASRVPCSSTPAWPEPATRSLPRSRRVSDKPIRDIVNTHIHPDHIGGNKMLSTTGGFASGGTTGGGRRDATVYCPRERSPADERNARQGKAARHRALAGEHVLQREEGDLPQRRGGRDPVSACAPTPTAT